MIKEPKNNFELLLTYIASIIVTILIYGIPIYFLWNLIMHNIFNLPSVTLGQAIGLRFLTALLFHPVKNK